MVRKSKYTKELLSPIVGSSYSLAQVLRALGLKTTGGNHRNISYWIKYHEISTEHFTGQGWANGQTRDSNKIIDGIAKKNSVPDEEFFVKNSKPVGGGKIARRLKRLGWEYKCAECGLEEWRDNPISLHVDHINGVGNDNRFENLRFLCPNCHQQTETWGHHGNNENSSKPKRKYIRRALRRTNECMECGTPITPVAKRCRPCAKIGSCKITWPPVEELEQMVQESSYLAVGRKLGVSDNAVRKHIKNYK